MRHSLIKTAAGRTSAAGDPLKVPGDSGGSSRESGTGGETIGRAVAGKLGYEYFDKKKIFGEPWKSSTTGRRSSSAASSTAKESLERVREIATRTAAPAKVKIELHYREA